MSEKKRTAPYIITISRQIGSGGAYIGKQLASKLGISYVDREIVSRAAQQLNISEDSLISRDERVTPLWRSVLEQSVFGSPYTYVPPPLNIPDDKELYRAESDIIMDIAKHGSAVIIGRGAYHVLRSHPRRLSIFLHADVAFREQRIQELYHLSLPEAQKRIQSTDNSRASYLRLITGEDWTDARQYNISLDTGILGFELVEDVVAAAAHARFD
ncbi:MAG: cytidylate kinase-like family protein [Dehalococcoidia bacterium]|nr:cytidylate kinase-like family protein [Dehalococcoidia bacterium]